MENENKNETKNEIKVELMNVKENEIIQKIENTTETNINTFFKNLYDNILITQKNCVIEVRVIKNNRVYSKFFDKTDDIIKYAKKCSDAGADVYFNPHLKKSQNGNLNSILYVVGFVTDIDFGKDGHKKTPQYETYEEAIAAVKRFILPPTFIILSGGGLHCYWIFKTPILINAENGESTKRLTQISKKLSLKIKGECYDLPHIFRVPGTFNYKLPQCRPVEVIEVNQENKYELADFACFENNINDSDNLHFINDIDESNQINKNVIINTDLNGDASDNINIDSIKISELYKTIIKNGIDQNCDRSSIDFSIVLSLIKAGLTDSQIKSIYNNYAIGKNGKMAEKGRHGDDYLNVTIKNAHIQIAGNEINNKQEITESENDINDEKLFEDISDDEIKTKRAIMLSNDNIRLDISKLPKPIQDWISLVGDKTEAPDEYLAVTFISVNASQIGNNVAIKVGLRNIYGNCYMMLLGPSSIAKKSSALNFGRNLTLQAHKKMSDEYKRQFEIYEQTSSTLTGKQAKFSLKQRCPARSMIELPADITMPRMYELLANNPVVIIYSNELASFLKKMQRDYNLDAKAVFTEFYDVLDLIEKETKSGGLIQIYKPCISILACSTAEWLMASNEKFDAESGWLPRWLMVNINHRTKPLIPVPAPFDDSLLDEFILLLDCIREFGQQHKNGLSIPLSPEAEKLYSDFYIKINLEIDRHPFSSTIAPFHTRILCDYCLKFCLLFTVWEIVLSNAPAVVCEETMRQAIYLSEYFIKNSDQVVLSKIDIGSVSLEKKIIERLKDATKHTLSKTVLKRKFNVTKREFDDAITNLKEQELIAEKLLKNKTKSMIVYSLIK